jgi:predicted dehydrogenase
MRDAGPQDRLRVAVVGVGAIARDWLAVIAQDSAVELVAVVDSDAKARAAASQIVMVPSFGSVRELVAEVQLDAALVTTPPAAHEHVALDLLARRVHVLCEKPLALTASAAGRLVHAASRSDVRLMMASKFRYVPDLIEAQRMIAGGTLGEPILFENSFCSPVDMTHRWNSDPQVSGGGVLIDNGCHSVDIVRLLLGPIVRVFAHFGRRVQPIRVEDSVRMLFETARACVGLIDVSWSVDKAAEHFVSVQGTGGTLQIGWRGSRYRLAGDNAWREFGAGYDKRAALAAQLQNFTAVIRGREEPMVSADDALASVRVIEAAYRSARVGRWVPVGYAGS